MRRTRVIPVLLIHQGGVYKTTKFKNPVYIGDPINAIRLFNDMEVDEIVVVDIDAAKQSREPNYIMIQELATEAFMPFAYGGGVRTVEQARRILQSGIEKILINHATHNDWILVSDCARQFGSQSVVASIDYGKKLIGGYRRFDHVTHKLLSDALMDTVKAAEHAGAGEVLINSVDRDGTMQGLDVAIIQQVASELTLPLIVCGGAGSLEHLQQAEQAGASAIAAGSMFVFHGKQRGVLINYPKESQLREYLH